jgi:hypothetical protein
MIIDRLYTVILLGRRLEVGMIQAYIFSVLGWLGFLKVKVSKGVTQCSPTGLESMPHTSVALMGHSI